MQSNGIKIKEYNSTLQKNLNTKMQWWMTFMIRFFPKKLTKDYAIDKHEILEIRDIGFCFLEYGNQFVDVVDISSTGNVFSHCCFGTNNPLFHAGNIRTDKWEKIITFKPKCNYDMVLKKFEDKKLCSPMDACTLCTQCWDKEGFIQS